MLLPTVMRTTQESLKTVPDAYREAALGLGSGKWRMIRTVVLPGAVDGMVTGCILAAGRVMGESAALLYTAGSASLLAESLYELLTTSGGSLSVALYLFTMERGEVEVGFAIASVLLLLTLLLNFAARMTGKGRRTA
jgi:phosphate transport system permease protein